jgi:hypothetical protein|tara:strand:- start:3041 stop:4270 length:1230 start_codon:yes stop_codon:yes gene_type:complete
MKQQIFSLSENKLTTDYEVVLDLGEQPWGNNFLTEDQVGKEPFYPLKLVYCNKSELLQLSYFVPKEVMFSNHTYLSGMTKSLQSHFYNIAKENFEDLNLSFDDIVVDIGGNDGTQLLQYKKLGFNNVINIESAGNICKLSEESGIKSHHMFFNEENVKGVIDKGSVKLINASGVFFHLEELHSVIRGMDYILSDDGVFVVQFMYSGAMVENGNFDTIYHEHLCYYTINSICKLLSKYGLKIFDAQFVEIHSGTIIAKFCKESCDKYPVTKRCLEQIERDKKYDLQSFLELGEYIKGRRDNLRSFLKGLKDNNKTIYAYGAPVKGNTLLNYMRIDNTIIDKVVEVNPLKIGKYTPGTNILVTEESVDDLPDYYLLLSHNFKDEILKKNKDLLDKGVKFIVPFPKVEVIES